MDDLFATATRDQFRYDSPVGPLTTEQLWQLPLLSVRSGAGSLNDCAVRISKQIKEQGEESFVEGRSNPLKAALEKRLDVVKFVIAVRQAENAAATERSAKASQRAKIDDIIAGKKDEALVGMSIEELEAMKQAL